MITKGQRDKFRECVIAQDDDNDYSESGWVAVVDGDWAALTKYGHCSCYDTWASITNGGISDDEGPDEPKWDWQGTVSELIGMATFKADPGFKGRIADPEDYDYDHLMKVYEQVLEWYGKSSHLEKVIVKDHDNTITIAQDFCQRTISDLNRGEATLKYDTLEAFCKLCTQCGISTMQIL